MVFGRKNLFSAMDAFPLTDAVLEFDDSSSVAVRPGRRALDGFGPRGERSASSKWWAVAGLIGLYAVALAGFYALGVVGAHVLWVLAGLTAAGFAVFGAVFRLGLQRQLRLRHLKLGIVTTAIGGMLVVFYLEPVTQILLAPFMFVAAAYGIFTVPRRTLLVLTVWTFMVFDIIFGMTGGGPAQSTQVLALWSYTQSFSNPAFGAGGAVAISASISSRVR